VKNEKKKKEERKKKKKGGFEIGDGRNIHLWFDWWHREGVLYERYARCVICDA
jgi:hypothetical protein